MKMTDKVRNESIETLRKLLSPGDKVYTILRHVSRSGMQRRISLIFAHAQGEIEDITWEAARALGDPVKQGSRYVQDGGMVVNGCGMDMGFHVVYQLSGVLFPNGFGVVGTTKTGLKITPASKKAAADAVKLGTKFYGRNCDKSGWDTDGGYALKQEWL